MTASEDQILEALPMVRRMASRYRRTPLGVEDAVGVGALALVEAGRRYDPGRGVPFAGFAFRRVRGALTDACTAGAGTRRCTPDEEVPWDPDLFREIGDLRSLHQEGRLDILTALAGLRCRLRTVLVRHACGVPHRKIAEDLGVTESRVSQLLTTARRLVLAETDVSFD
jgi:RNA polymerase sigma factor (sigma-70 family)